MSKNIKVEEIIVPPNATYLNNLFIFIRKYDFLFPFLIFPLVFIGYVIFELVNARLENNISPIIIHTVTDFFVFSLISLLLVALLFLLACISNFIYRFLPRRRFFNKLTSQLKRLGYKIEKIKNHFFLSYSEAKAVSMRDKSNLIIQYIEPVSLNLSKVFIYSLSFYLQKDVSLRNIFAIPILPVEGKGLFGIGKMQISRYRYRKIIESDGKILYEIEFRTIVEELSIDEVLRMLEKMRNQIVNG
ncbi:MAG: hypothetical protein QME57_02605 [Patescibacteria group bacterium]|nr:hypothetical protein [Patescibacteria group bacterium]